MKRIVFLSAIGLALALPLTAEANVGEFCLDTKGMETPIVFGQVCEGTYVTKMEPNVTYQAYCVKQPTGTNALEIKSWTDISISYVCHSAVAGDIKHLYLCYDLKTVIRHNGLQVDQNGTSDDVWCQRKIKK